MSGADLLFIVSFIILPTAILVSCIWLLILIRKGVLLPQTRSSLREETVTQDEMTPATTEAERALVTQPLTVSSDGEAATLAERTQEFDGAEPTIVQSDAAQVDATAIQLDVTPDDGAVADIGSTTVIEHSDERPADAPVTKPAEPALNDDEREITEELEVVPVVAEGQPEDQAITAATEQSSADETSEHLTEPRGASVATREQHRKPLRRLIHLKPTEGRADRGRVRIGQRRQAPGVAAAEQSVAENEGAV